VQRFFDRWMTRIPTPLGKPERAAGYWWGCRCAGSRCSRALDDDPRARRFFEALVTDNIGIGRPEAVAAVFARRVQVNPLLAGPLAEDRATPYR